MGNQTISNVVEWGANFLKRKTMRADGGGYNYFYYYRKAPDQIYTFCSLEMLRRSIPVSLMPFAEFLDETHC